jgi:heat shock protein HtpX
MARQVTRRRWRRPQRLTLEGPPVARREDLVVPDVLTLEPALAWHENRRRMAILLGAFLVLSIVEGGAIGAVVGRWWLGIPAGAGLALLWLVVAARFGDGWMRQALGAERARSALLWNALEGTVERSGIPAPELAVTKGPAPNAIALGLRRRWICVTTGAARLQRVEIEGLIAHEVAHLRDGDAALASAYVVLAGAPELTVRSAGAPGRLLTVLSVPLWPVAVGLRVLRNVVTPSDREHRADVAAALITRYPPGLRAALQAASVEHGSGKLRAADPFWFAPRTSTPGPDLARRAELVSEM